jgi:O-antigen ligase
MVSNLKQLRNTSTAERIFFTVIVLNFLWMAFSYYYNGEPGRGASFLWGRHFYFLFLIPLFFLFRKIDISDNVILLSLFFSVTLSFTDILIDFSQGVDHRIQGTNPNAFGPIQLCFSGILLLSFIYISGSWQRSVALIGFVLAISTVIFSLSRNTWFTLAVLSLFFVFYLARSQPIWKKTALAMGILLLLSSSYLLPIVKFRIDNSISNLSAFFASDDYEDVSRTTSFGIRTELWRTGWYIFLENPVTGAGLGSFQMMARENWQRYKVNKFVSNFKYAHNQYIAALATRGIPGLILLLMVLFLPIYIAMSKRSLDRDIGIKQLSIILICLVYIIGCFAEDHFEVKASTMFVTVLLALLLAGISTGDSQQITENSV